jgi:hypothetical protein
MKNLKFAIAILVFSIGTTIANAETNECSMVKGLRVGISALREVPSTLKLTKTEAAKAISLRNAQIQSVLTNINDSKIKEILNASALTILERVEGKLTEGVVVGRCKDCAKEFFDQTRALSTAKNYFISVQNMSCGNTDWGINQ